MIMNDDFEIFLKIYQINR